MTNTNELMNVNALRMLSVAQVEGSQFRSSRASLGSCTHGLYPMVQVFEC